MIRRPRGIEVPCVARPEGADLDIGLDAQELQVEGDEYIYRGGVESPADKIGEYVLAALS